MSGENRSLLECLPAAQVCLPFLGCAVALLLRKHPRALRLVFSGLCLLLGVVSACVLIALLKGGPVPPLAWGFAGAGLFDEIVWATDFQTAPIVACLPWIALTALAFTAESRLSFSSLTNLLLLGGMTLTFVGRDAGSLLTGAALTVMTLSTALGRQGGPDRKIWGGTFLAAQVTGWLLITAGIAALVGIASVVRHAPEGVPGISTTNLLKLGELLAEVQGRNPAARFLWGQYQNVPLALLVLGGAIVVGLFPFHSWMFRGMASASLGERLWLTVWCKGLMLLGIRLLILLMGDAVGQAAWWGCTLGLVGALYASLILFAQGDFPGIQSSVLLWSNQWTLIGMCSLSGEAEALLVPVVISQLCGLLLLAAATSCLPERYQSLELASWQGISQKAPWLGVVLGGSLLTLTCTPLAAGLGLTWISINILRLEGSVAGTFSPLLLIGANLIVLAGLGRLATRLLTGPLRLPEMSPVLEERTQLPHVERDLTLSLSQKVMLGIWAGLAIGISWTFLLFLFQIVLQQGTGGE